MADTARAAAEQAARVAGNTRPLLVVDDDCVCVEASLGASRLLGAARGEVVGREVEALLEPDSRERFAHVWRAFRSGGGQAEPFTLEAPATVATVSISVTAAIVPGRHLISFDPAAPPDREAEVAPEHERATSADQSRAGGRPPTARECQVLSLLARGSTDGQIASELELSPATVQTHVRNAKAKLGARTRAQAVALAIRRGLIGSP